jgi:membrane-bound lytic murein transglycosylase B
MSLPGTLPRAVVSIVVALVAVCAVLVAAPAEASANATGGTAPPEAAAGDPQRDSGGVAPGSVPLPSEAEEPQSRRRKRRRRPAGGPAVSDIPRAYLRYYRKAGRASGVDWRILAAVGKSESDHGRTPARGVTFGLNAAECCAGPMQLCIVAKCGNVWQQYAVDANGNGRASVYEPGDAIFAAAALLHDLQDRFGTRPDLLLAAYHAGPGAVARHNGVPDFRDTEAYVEAGLRYRAQLR